MADLDFGKLKPGGSSTKSVTAPLLGSATPAISGDSGFVVTDVSGRRIEVTFTAGQVPAGAKTATLTAGENTFSLEAEVEHQLTVASSLYVGAALVGASATKTLSVTNRTDADATVTVTGDFTASPTTVAAGTGPQVITITFTPTATETRQGGLTIDNGTLRDVCDLSGTGLAADDTSTAGSLGVDSLETTGSGSDTKTTYKVHVPSYATKMHLGAAVTPFSDLDGFGLTTTAKGLLEASGNIGVHSTGGDVMIQASSGTNGGVYTVSKNNTVFAAGGSAYLVGDGGVTITTAVDVEPTTTSDGLPSPGDMTQGSNVAAGIFAALDGLVALASLFRVGYTTWRDFSSINKTDVGMAVVSGGAALTATTLGGFSVANAAGASFSVPGVTIYGHAGVLIGTAGFGGFYAPAGLVLGSIFPVLLGMDAELLGLRTANLTGRHVNVNGFKDASVSGGDDVNITAGSTLNLKVNPTDVGGVGARSTELVFDTASVKGKAPTLFSFQVGSGTVYVVRVQDTGIQIGVGDAAGLLDRTKPHAKLTDAEIKLAFKDGGAEATIQDNVIRMKQSPTGHGITLNNDVASVYNKAAKMWVKVASNAIEMRAGSSANQVQLTPSGVTAKGTLIKWG